MVYNHYIKNYPDQLGYDIDSGNKASISYDINFIYRCPDDVVEKLEKTKENRIDFGDVLATRLCTHKENVEQINKVQLQSLPGKSMLFQAIDSDHNFAKTLDSCCPVKAKLELKVGAQVSYMHYMIYIIHACKHVPRNINLALGIYLQ